MAAFRTSARILPENDGHVPKHDFISRRTKNLRPTTTHSQAIIYLYITAINMYASSARAYFVLVMGLGSFKT